jgi:hypothetical protein
MPSIITRPACKTAEDALAAAIVAAADMEEDVELYDATFGRYADLDAGWWWELKFLRTLGMTSHAGSGDAFAKRAGRIISLWTQSVARYADDDDKGDRHDENR